MTDDSNDDKKEGIVSAQHIVISTSLTRVNRLFLQST